MDRIFTCLILWWLIFFSFLLKLRLGIGSIQRRAPMCRVVNFFLEESRILIHFRSVYINKYRRGLKPYISSRTKSTCRFCKHMSLPIKIHTFMCKPYFDLWWMSENHHIIRTPSFIRQGRTLNQPLETRVRGAAAGKESPRAYNGPEWGPTLTQSLGTSRLMKSGLGRNT